MRLQFASASDQGAVLSYNHDAILVAPGRMLFLLADGLGSNPVAGLVSKQAIASFATAMQESSESASKDLRTAMASAMKHTASSLHEVFSGVETSKLRATTLTALQFSATDYCIIHIGDSRAYLLRGGTLLQLSNDHSVAWEQYKCGAISKEELANHPNQQVLTRTLNAANDSAVPEITEGTITNQDLFLLCSDGLSCELTDAEIQTILEQHPIPEEACQALLKAAKANGGQDNISLILIQVQD